MPRSTWISCVLPVLLACSASGRDIESSPAPGGSASAAPQPSGSSSSTPGINGSPDGGPSDKPQIDEVYGQSGFDLYRLDPTTKAVTHVGTFQGCSGGVIDIALDADSNLYGTTSKGLYRIDRQTAKCTEIATGDYPNSLSFVPKGTVDPNEEALVGYNDDTYVRIDTKSGNVSNIGSLGQGYTSSGDIVSVIGGGTYLTVKGQGCSDCIVEVNPATGAMKRKLGSVGHKDVFGLAFWAGSAYGFDLGGELFEIQFNGNGVTTKPISIPKAPADLAFWGAGSSTSAPVTAVK